MLGRNVFTVIARIGVISLISLVSQNSAIANVVSGSLQGTQEQPGKSEELDALRVEIERFVQEEDYKEMRQLCRMEYVKTVRIQRPLVK